MKKNPLPALLLLCTLCACEKEDVPPPYPTTRFSEIEVTYQDYYVYSYRFTDGRLTQVLNSQKEVESASTTTQITYGDHQATIQLHTSQTRNVKAYTLNDRGYAVSCHETSGNTIYDYTFDYVEIEGKTYIAEVRDKSYLPKYEYITTFHYDKPNTVRILKMEMTDNQLTDKDEVILTAPGKLPNISEVVSPCQLVGFPYSDHRVAIYGKLLGEFYPYLLTHLEYNSYDASDNIEQSFSEVSTYTLDERGVVSKCQIAGSSGRVTDLYDYRIQ
jgi:hypothetical protein